MRDFLAKILLVLGAGVLLGQQLVARHDHCAIAKEGVTIIHYGHDKENDSILTLGSFHSFSQSKLKSGGVKKADFSPYPVLYDHFVFSFWNRVNLLSDQIDSETSIRTIPLYFSFRGPPAI